VIMRLWPQIEAFYQWSFGQAPPWRSTDAPSLSAATIVRPVLGGLALLAVAGLMFRIFRPYAFDGPGFFDVFRWNLEYKDVFSVSGLLHLEFIKPTHYIAFSDKYRNDIGGLLSQQNGQDFPPN